MVRASVRDCILMKRLLLLGKKEKANVWVVYIYREGYIYERFLSKENHDVKRLGEEYLCDVRRKKKEAEKGDKGRGTDIYDQHVMDVNM